MDAERLEARFRKWAAPRAADDRYATYRVAVSNFRDQDRFWADCERHALRVEASKAPVLHYLIMGAVHFLVLKSPSCALAQYFPSVAGSETRLTPLELGRAFEDFYWSRHTNIWEIISSRDVQIAKLGRLSLLTIALKCIENNISIDPYTFVDVGTSAGFGMLWQNFAYDFGPHGKFGPSAPLDELRCSIESSSNLGLSGAIRSPERAVGIDPAPIFANDEDGRLWLRALTAPDDPSGHNQLRSGLAAVQNAGLEIIRGCVTEVLPHLESVIPLDHTLIVHHAMVMHHLRSQQKEEFFLRLLHEISRRRSVIRVGVEWRGGLDPKTSSLVDVYAVNIATGETFVRGVTDSSADGTQLVVTGFLPGPKRAKFSPP